jgi:hypothetical protein
MPRKIKPTKKRKPPSKAIKERNARIEALVEKCQHVRVPTAEELASAVPLGAGLPFDPGGKKPDLDEMLITQLDSYVKRLRIFGPDDHPILSPRDFRRVVEALGNARNVLDELRPSRPLPSGAMVRWLRGQQIVDDPPPEYEALRRRVEVEVRGQVRRLLLTIMDNGRVVAEEFKAQEWQKKNCKRSWEDLLHRARELLKQWDAPYELLLQKDGSAVLLPISTPEKLGKA